MKSLGYVQSQYNASLFYNPQTGVQVLVHGDDFVAVGEREYIKKLQSQLAGRFTVKCKIVGPDFSAGDVQVARIRNRIIRCGGEG